MRTNRLSLATLALLFTLTSSGLASIETIYNEEFSVDPSLTDFGGYEPGVEECFCYCYTPLPGVYRVRLSETTDHADKFVGSDPFSMVGGSFRVSLDVNIVGSSFGMPIGMQVLHSVTEDIGLSISFAGDHDRVLRFADNNGHLYTMDVDYQVWYHVVLDYNAYDHEVDIRMYDRDTGTLTESLTNAAFLPGQFDKVRLGWITGVGDGTSAEMLFDNIRIYDLPENWNYVEPFEWDPGYGFCTGYVPTGSEIFDHDPTMGVYHVKIDETSDHTDKYACSPVFDLVDPALFYKISVDMNFWDSSFGMPIGMKLGESGDVTDKLAISYSGTHDELLRISDGQGNLYTTPADLQRWYRVEITEVDDDSVDIVVSDRESGELVTEWTNVPFAPPAFDQYMVGWGTGVGDGTVAELLVDNVCVETLPFPPSTAPEIPGATSMASISRFQAWPNPGSDPTISFGLGRPLDSARLTVNDAAGREVASIELGRLTEGRHQIRLADLDPRVRRLPSGRYFARMTAEGLGRAEVSFSLIR